MIPGTQELKKRARKRVGTVLKDKWQLDELLGVGGMASVYRATHRNGNEVAIKVLHPELSVHEELRGRFLREGYAGNKVKHSGVVTVHDDDVADDGAVFLVMELIEGETLKAWRRRHGGTLPVADVLLVADQLLDTLAAAHSRGVLHRDLKPDNLVVTQDGELKVLDFGIARLRELSGNTGATQTGHLLGTPLFMPPEQARGRWDDVDDRSDLWSVGATMFRLLSGQFVHEAETPTEALAMAVTQKARSLAAVADDLPPSLVALVDKSLAYDKEDRWDDAHAMQQALRKCYLEIEGEEVPTTASISRRLLQAEPAARSGCGEAEPAETMSGLARTLPSENRSQPSVGAPSQPTSGRAAGYASNPARASSPGARQDGTGAPELRATPGDSEAPTQLTPASVTPAPTPAPAPSAPSMPAALPSAPGPVAAVPSAPGSMPSPTPVSLGELSLALPQRSRKGLMVAGALGAVAVGGLVAWLGFGGGAAPAVAPAETDTPAAARSGGDGPPAAAETTAAHSAATASASASSPEPGGPPTTTGAGPPPEPTATTANTTKTAPTTTAPPSTGAAAPIDDPFGRSQK